ncbi:hypothetical protein RIF29_28752 [Crotalaria pallida]|uniref:Uncharacterized protein n=1 Tax=Crotalaria pallida TaxID=3830 RepID=A0AAN9EDD0_CROPI
MASNNNVNGEKGERRRRIAERGSDRMALITGRINALPPTQNSGTSSPTQRQPPRHAQSLSYHHHEPDLADDLVNPRHSRPHSLSPAFYSDYHEDQDQDHHTGSAEVKHVASNPSSRLKHQSGFKYSNFNNFDNIVEEEPLIQEESGTISEINYQKSEHDDGAKTKTSPVTSRTQNGALDTKTKTSSVTSRTQNGALDTKTKTSSVTSRTRNGALGTKQQTKPGRQKHTFFSSRELNLCILASETTRALSSLIIALLVVFFYMISESIVATRPPYIVLLTDITIVLAHLHRIKAKVSEEAEGESVEAHGDEHNWGDAVKLMERGLVAYQAIRGIFIDCSIYIVVVVCGISLM